MNFADWLSLSDAERESEKGHWQPFEAGYWHSIAVEAAARFAAEFGSTPHITGVFKSLYHARELILAVQTDLSPPNEVKLPPSYLGFKVMQFASQIPDGVLVQPVRPGQPRRSRRAHVAQKSRRTRSAIPRPKTESHHIVPLEGEIDLHSSPEVAANLRALIKEKPSKIIIDLSKVPYIDSSGLAVLIDGMRKMEAFGGKLYLVGLQESVQLIFETTRLDQAFRILPDAAKALAAS